MPPERYQEIHKWGEEQLGVKLLTPEYEVASIFFDVDRMTPLDMLRHFSGSTAGFFKILKALESRDVLSTEANPSDGRSKFYRLSDRTLTTMAKQLSRYKETAPKNIYRTDDPNETIRNYTRLWVQDLKMKQFTCEYQIMLYLHASPGMTNIKFHDLVDVSGTKFNMSLDRLKKSGHVYYSQDPLDRRQKLYFLSDGVDMTFNELDKRIFDWLNTKPGFFARQLKRTQ